MKKIILALTLGLLIGSATTALAATSETVQATLHKFNFKINGKVAEVNTTPLEKDGTSYLPVRELAGLLGYDVDYDDATNTILLDFPKSEPTATNPIEKDGAKVTAISNEWISMRELNSFYGINVVANSDKLTLTNSSEETIEIFFLHIDGNIVGGSNRDGTVSIKVENSSTVVNVRELKNVGFIQ